MPIVTGILLGLSTLLFVGPVFFYLIKSSMESGVKSGIAVAGGIILGDLICVFLAVYGVGKYLEIPIVQKWFAISGGFILIAMGIKPFVSAKRKKVQEVTKKANSLLKYGLNGFLVNFVNPFVFAVWFGFYTILINKYNSDVEVKAALLFILITIFLTDILKAVFAHKIKRIIVPKIFDKTLKIIGFIMILFGVRLIISLFM
jgi:threonine/homoserine/homoserine lactone efflux protein